MLGVAGGELGAGGRHGELDQAFAGQVGLLVQVNHREPVEQRAKADREVAGRYLKAERALLLAALHDLGEIVIPRAHELIEETAHLRIVRGARPRLGPQDPGGVGGATRQVQVGEPLELAPRARNLGENGAAAPGFLVLAPRQRLEQDVLLGARIQALGLDLAEVRRLTDSGGPDAQPATTRRPG